MGTVHRTKLDNGVVLLELDAPPMNAMSGTMLAVVSDALVEVQSDDTLRAIVLTGRGRAFCSGADLKEAAAEAMGGVASGGEDLTAFGRVLEQLAASRVPVVGAVNGACVGGGFELALCCDIRIASTEAKFVCAGVNVGLMASTYRLPRLIGLSRAKAMLLTGLPHDAATAERWGLVTGVFAADLLLDEAVRLAQRIASRAPLSVEASKRTADRALDMSPEEGRAAMSAEIPVLRASADHREGIMAFIERREPRFTRG